MESYTPSITDKHPPDIDGNPIEWDDNKAHLEGVMNDFKDYLSRTGKFRALIEQHAVRLSNADSTVLRQ